MHLIKPLLQQMGCGLLAANPTGAKQGQLVGTARLHQGAQFLSGPSGKLAEALGLRIHGPGKAANPHLVAVAGIDHQGGGIGNQLIPLLWRHVGPHLLGGINALAAHGHDLRLQPHLEAQKAGLITPAALFFQSLKARLYTQAIEQCADRFRLAAHRAIDPFSGEQHRAQHPLIAAELLQLRAQLLQVLQRRKAIERRHQHRAVVGHQAAATPSKLLLTPAAARSA